MKSTVKKAVRFIAFLRLLLRKQRYYVMLGMWEEAEYAALKIRKSSEAVERLSGKLKKNQNKALSEILPRLTLNRLKSCIEINHYIESVYESEARKASKELFNYKADLALLKLRRSADAKIQE
jgi:hypothetical protein